MRFKNDEPDTTVTHDIIHSTMVANPSVEVYLLDTLGNIVDYVSHDLRTPLSITQGYLETMMIKKDSLSGAEGEKYLTIINDSVVKLTGLVEQLFQYAKLEANLVTTEKELFMVNELVSDILMSYQLKAEQKHILLSMDALPGLPPVFADVALTERVFQNLLDNAFKFTPEGGQISIKLKETNKGVNVIVEDTGIGIPQEEQTFIFERYKQINNDITPQRGMGIGLAIVKKIIELHHSTINVNSRMGKGTIFNFVLPVSPGAGMAF